MPSLISREEALRLGEITDRAEIEALIERAWRVRQDRFGDSTDMCSLVNAKSGGCAEDCGFCSQSRFAEADTPMHAMMDAEQILEHARAAEAAGAEEAVAARAPVGVVSPLNGDPASLAPRSRLSETGRAAPAPW